MSKGVGNMVKFETSKEKFDFLVNGTKWWVISTAGVTDPWSSREYIKEAKTNSPRLHI